MRKTKNNGKKLTILRGEKILYILLFFLIVTLPMVNVFVKALLSETNIEVEQLKIKIDDQENINESLNMQINELASLDKIQEVAKNMGLSYNNDNIKIVSNGN